MNSMDLNHEISQISKKISSLTEKIESIAKLIKPEKDLWDKQDMLENWHISERTLAQWRAEGQLDYVQLGKKIWYPKSARESFLERNFKSKNVMNEENS